DPAVHVRDKSSFTPASREFSKRSPPRKPPRTLTTGVSFASQTRTRAPLGSVHFSNSALRLTRGGDHFMRTRFILGGFNRAGFFAESAFNLLRKRASAFLIASFSPGDKQATFKFSTRMYFRATRT